MSKASGPPKLGALALHFSGRGTGAVVGNSMRECIENLGKADTVSGLAPRDPREFETARCLSVLGGATAYGRAPGYRCSSPEGSCQRA
eukprot:9500164-Pyramimonas_sp.AAC.1